jgi:hypothetical protein
VRLLERLQRLVFLPRNAIIVGTIVIGAIFFGALGALVQQWRIDARDLSFVDCDGKRQTLTRDDRFAIIVGDTGCMTLLRTPDRVKVTCTVGGRDAIEGEERKK